MLIQIYVLKIVLKMVLHRDVLKYEIIYLKILKICNINWSTSPAHPLRIARVGDPKHIYNYLFKNICKIFSLSSLFNFFWKISPKFLDGNLGSYSKIYFGPWASMLMCARNVKTHFFILSGSPLFKAVFFTVQSKRCRFPNFYEYLSILTLFK